MSETIKRTAQVRALSPDKGVIAFKDESSFEGDKEKLKWHPTSDKVKPYLKSINKEEYVTYECDKEKGTITYITHAKPEDVSSNAPAPAVDVNPASAVPGSSFAQRTMNPDDKFDFGMAVNNSIAFIQYGGCADLPQDTPPLNMMSTAITRIYTMLKALRQELVK